jgi:hypothetical protein
VSSRAQRGAAQPRNGVGSAPRSLRGRGLGAKTFALIEAGAEVLAAIQPASVRAVCYKLFTQGRIPDMSKLSTNRVSRALVIARERGLVSWRWIVDETRAPERVPTWEDPEAILRAVEQQYRKDRWALQPQRVEVWAEKGTIRGTLAPVLDAYAVTFRVMHGYGSATQVKGVADESREDEGRPFVALYVGDWDPSGLHMSEVDLPGRLRDYGGVVDLRRLAISAEDTATDAIPSFPASDKQKDGRYAWYVGRFGVGARCWELDALDPRILRERVQAAIDAEIAWPAWERSGRAEAAERESLTTVVRTWQQTKFGRASE